MTPQNTRVAPSPTGFFHLGTARTAYHNWLAAKATGGQFLLRIDDTDAVRNNPEFTQLIYQAMEWLGLDFDATFEQSSRKSHYLTVAQLLVDKGLAVLADGAIRLKTDYVVDTWADGYKNVMAVSQKDNDISNALVLIKSDGNPTYHFASVVDDVDYQITLIIRGADHISNTIKQLFILRALTDSGYVSTLPPIDFLHVGLIMADGKKMSKRDGSSNLLIYQQNHYHPDAILNYILKLGWSHPDPTFDSKYPVIDKDLATRMFFEGRLKATNCSFDARKLDWLNKKHHALKPESGFSL